MPMPNSGVSVLLVYIASGTAPFPRSFLLFPSFSVETTIRASQIFPKIWSTTHLRKSFLGQSDADVQRRATMMITTVFCRAISKILLNLSTRLPAFLFLFGIEPHMSVLDCMSAFGRRLGIFEDVVSRLWMYSFEIWIRFCLWWDVNFVKLSSSYLRKYAMQRRYVLRSKMSSY